MAATTLRQVREALQAGLLTITTANGYGITILPKNLYKTYTAGVMNNKKDGDYPKVFVLLDKGDNKKMPSNRYEKLVTYIVIIVTRALASETLTPQEKIEGIIEDVDAMLHANDTLGTKVTDATLVGFTSDSGNVHPEASAAFKIECLYYVQR
jgi:hypothetical protein